MGVIIIIMIVIMIMVVTVLHSIIMIDTIVKFG